MVDEEGGTRQQIGASALTPQPPHRLCRSCKSAMASADLPQVGLVYQCMKCASHLESGEGDIYPWKKPPRSRRWIDYNEDRHMSQRPCPECGAHMWEVVREHYGPRWQCESCRLTLLGSGEVQRWRSGRS